MTQIFALHSAYGLVTAAAAIDGGLLPDSGDRLLVSFVSSRVPETSVGVGDDPQLDSLRGRFDRHEDLGDLLGAQHPSDWRPTPTDLPILQRLLTRAWRVDEADLELFVQSPQVAPALTLMSIFPHARITIIGDGLMTYAPMRVRMRHTMTARIGRVVYADALAGVTPLVASPGAECVPVPADLFRAALGETAAVSDPVVDELIASAGEDSGTALVLGQYLAALGLVTEREEVGLQSEMIDRAAERGAVRVVFKPHPAAPPRLSGLLRERAVRHGMEFREYRGPLAAEVLAERLDAIVVIAGFSTALPTVRWLTGRPIDAVGTDRVLHRLTPYENSNRIPATIVDALTRSGSTYREPERMQLLIDGVGYAMQPHIARHLRPRAERLFATMPQADAERYITPARLAATRLPGAPEQGMIARALRSGGGIGRVEELRLTVHGAARRVRRAWRVLRGR